MGLQDRCQDAKAATIASTVAGIHTQGCLGPDLRFRDGNGTPCRSVAVNAMKSLIVALLAVFTLLTSLLSPVPALALSNPDISLGSPYPLPTVLLTKKTDAKAKTLEGRLQSASGDLTGNNGDKVKGAAKQVQGSAMNTAANLQKANKNADKAS